MPTDREPTCRVCGNERGNRTLHAREPMFGLPETFEYTECADCGCVQIASVPADMSPYYPSDYYSKANDPWPQRFAAERWVAQAVDERTLIGALVTAFLGRHPLGEWSERAGLTRDSRVLDVGCGGGTLLRRMQHAGFRHLTGVDAFLDADLVDEHITIKKADFLEMDGQFDCIMFHHSFEHMSAPEEVLAHARRLLAPGGCVLMRIPIVDSWAYETYGVDWAQFDAPRHFFLHSRKSIEILAVRTGLFVERADCDSTSLQIWSSEQNRMGIPHRSARSFAVNPLLSRISLLDVWRYNRRAIELNRTARGDQACFYLRVR